MKRSGNIELLRIVIMFMILVLHANHATFMPPKAPLSSVGIARNFLESLTYVPVNIFVLITGYFGTKFKLRKIAILLYQCAFAVIPISLILLLTQICKCDSILGMIMSFNFLCYWFIIAYIGLIICSPILNLVLKSLSKRQLFILLCLLYLFFGIGDYVHLQSTAITTNGGYSTLWFCILYLIGGYISKFNPFTTIRSWEWFHIYIVCAIALTFISMPIAFLGISYDNPFTLIASIALFMSFIKLNVNNDKILFVASGTTMVYLLNTHPLIFPIFKKHILGLYDRYPLLEFILYTICYLLLFFVCSVLYDKLREFTWNRMKNLINNFCDKIDDNLDLNKMQ